MKIINFKYLMKNKFVALIIDDINSNDVLYNKINHNEEISIITINDINNSIDILNRYNINIIIINLKNNFTINRKILNELKLPYSEINLTNKKDCITIIYDENNNIININHLQKEADSNLISETILNEYNKWTECKILNKNINCESIIGNCDLINSMKNNIIKIAKADTTVLISGESGTGKELIAKELHFNSSRKNNPFIAINCASINESLLESELFGHAKGSFTGADCDYIGLVKSAHTGTLFLDEIGETSLHIQAKLLRMIQERTIRPVGSTKTFHTDVRIIAATNRDLLSDISNNLFRNDLYYRISTVTITAPPLRERGEDIEILACHFLNQCRNFHGNKITASKEFLNALKAYDWPGNVRELENTLLGISILLENDVLTLSDLPQNIINNNNTIKATSVKAAEKEAIQNALEASNYDRMLATQMLGISQSTLYRKIKEYGLKRPSQARSLFRSPDRNALFIS